MQAGASARAEELLAEADGLDRISGWMDDATARPLTLKQMHYDAHAAKRRRRPGPDGA